MSAPVNRTQSEPQEERGIAEMAVEEIKMNTISQINRAKTWVVNSFKTKLPLKLVTGVALGAMFLTAVVGFPFGSTDASDPANTVVSDSASGPSLDQQPVAYGMREEQGDQNSLAGVTMPTRKTSSRDEVADFFGDDVVAALGYEVLIARLNEYKSDGQLSSRDMERLDQEIGVLMIAAGEKSSETSSAYSREIDRLEGKISSMLAEASHNPSTNLSRLSREVERLDYQIDMLRLAGM